MPVHGSDVYMIMGLTSVVALSYNVVHSLMIQRTSAVTTTVLGEVKIIGLMVLSYVLLGACARVRGVRVRACVEGRRVCVCCSSV